MLFIRLAGLFFALVQISLVLRLALAFVEVPPGLVEYVPALIELTDRWILPVQLVAERFELTGLAEGVAEAGDATVSGPAEFEPIVIVAMIAWGVVAWFVLMVLRLIFRPAG